MNKFILASILVGVLFTCSDEMNEYPQKWTLVEMTGSIANAPPLTGNEMPWQEFYLLHADKTFLKSRREQGIVREETGTYNIGSNNGIKTIEFTYESDNDLIGNCSSEPIEFLTFDSKQILLSSGWAACDGPGLLYKRTE